jgi:hypothetical protein
LPDRKIMTPSGLRWLECALQRKCGGHEPYAATASIRNALITQSGDD